MSTLPPNTHKGVVSSAGSKVMLTGGYLVLHKPNNGLVLGVDARLHTGVYKLSDQKYPLKWGSIELDVKKYDNGAIGYPIVLLTPQLRQDVLVLYIMVKKIKHNEVNYVDINGVKFGSQFEFELIQDYAANSFASKSIHYSLIAISSFLSPERFLAILQNGLIIDIRGDRSFYSSQPVPNQQVTPGKSISLDGTTSTTPTTPSTTIMTESIIHENPSDYGTKTGLGSSAAVVSSLVSGLFSYFGLFDDDVTIDSTLSKQEIKTYAYRVAQIAHCIAQGKVGSGFDVATAFYGTQTYCRFSPSLLTPLMEKPLENTQTDFILVPKTQNLVKTNPNKPNPYSDSIGNETFFKVLTQQWDDQINQFLFPKYINIILADVQGGSETPGMVKKVEEWKKNGGIEAENCWEGLAAANRIIEGHFGELNKLSQQNEKIWIDVLDKCSVLPSNKWENILTSFQFEQKNGDKNGDKNAEFELKIQIIQELLTFVTNFHTVRTLLSKMGQSCDVPIEPPSQTSLIDLTCQQNGVICGGVPGAGGFDAVFAVIIDTPKNGLKIQNSIIQTWKSFTTDDGNAAQISQLPVSIDLNGGVQSRVAYKDFSELHF
jgi:phosphomevalonate kinase